MYMTVESQDFHSLSGDGSRVCTSSFLSGIHISGKQLKLFSHFLTATVSWLPVNMLFKWFRKSSIVCIPPGCICFTPWCYGNFMNGTFPSSPRNTFLGTMICTTGHRWNPQLTLIYPDCNRWHCVPNPLASLGPKGMYAKDFLERQFCRLGSKHLVQL